MILPIYVYGQPVLRKVAEDIDASYPDLKELIDNMFETMEISARFISMPISWKSVEMRYPWKKVA